MGFPPHGPDFMTWDFPHLSHGRMAQSLPWPVPRHRLKRRAFRRAHCAGSHGFPEHKLLKLLMQVNDGYRKCFSIPRMVAGMEIPMEYDGTGSVPTCPDIASMSLSFLAPTLHGSAAKNKLRIQLSEISREHLSRTCKGKGQKIMV